MPNNRQVALLIVVAMLLGVVLFWPTGRKAFLGIGRSRVRPRHLLQALVILSYVGLLVTGGHRMGWWNLSLITDTAFWMCASGVVFFFKSSNEIKKPRYFSRNLGKLVGWTVLVEFVAGLTTGPLWLELLLSALLTPIVFVLNWGETREEDKTLNSCLGWFLALVGFTMIFVSSWSLVSNVDSLDKANLFRQIMLPLWLTVGSLPLVYIFGMSRHYGKVGVWIRVVSKESFRQRLLLRLAVFREYGFKATRFDEILPHMSQVAKAKGYSEARKAIREIRKDTTAR